MLQSKDFKTKTVTRDKEGYYLMIKGSIQQLLYNNCKLLYNNNYIGAPKNIKQILTDIKEKINSSTVIVKDFNTSFTSIHKSSRQKIDKETLALKDMLSQMDLMYI